MSRIGNKPVVVPSGVEISIQDDVLSVKGAKGTLTQKFEPEYVSLKIEDGQLLVSRKDDSKEAKSRHGLYQSLAQNLVDGVSNGFSKTLEIKGVGYRVALKGKILEMQLGFSHPINFNIPEGIEISFPDEKNNNIVMISGINKQLVGQVAANIREYRKPEPYKGKGIRYIDEQVARKAGKSAAKAA